MASRERRQPRSTNAFTAIAVFKELTITFTRTINSKQRKSCLFSLNFNAILLFISASRICYNYLALIIVLFYDNIYPLLCNKLQVVWSSWVTVYRYPILISIIRLSSREPMILRLDRSVSGYATAAASRFFHVPIRLHSAFHWNQFSPLA